MDQTFASTVPSASIEDPRLFLWKDPQSSNVLSQNTANYELLSQSFSRSKFISFTGAGVSSALGVSDWGKLINELFAAAAAVGFTEKPSEKEQYPEYAERLFRHLEGNGHRDLYFNTIKARMAPRISSTSLSLIYLSLCIDIHLTTNFDRSLQNAFSFVDYLKGYFIEEGKHTQPQLYYIGNLNAHPNGPTIYYLHGSVSENIYILKKTDYDCFYPSVSGQVKNISSEVEDCLRHYYRSKTILFIGFSFEDKYLREYFFNLAEEMNREEEATRKFYSEAGKTIGDRKINHFLLIDENNAFVSRYGSDIFSEMQKYNLYPIIYKTGEHIFLEHLFKMLANKSRGLS